jgi:hypothetical protein
MEPKIESIICNGRQNGLNFEFLNKKLRIALIALIVLIGLLYLVHETGIGSLHKKMPHYFLLEGREVQAGFLIR